MSTVLALLLRGALAVGGSVRRSPRAWLVGALIAASALSVGLVVRAAEQRGRDQQRALERQHALAANTTALTQATAARESSTVTRAAVHASADQAVSAAAAARDLADRARAAHAATRSRIGITSDTSVSIDRAPPIAAPAAMIAAIVTGDTAAARDSAQHVADSTALAKRTAERDAIAAERDRIAVERDLWHARADTLEHAPAPSESSGCGTTCKVVVVGLAGGALYEIGRAIVARMHDAHPAGGAAADRRPLAIPLVHLRW